jgi:hypothetical protein
VNGLRARIADAAAMTLLAVRLQLGQFFWLAPCLVLAWPLLHAGLAMARLNPIDFNAANAQNWLIGLPLNVLAIGIGIGVIADEIEQRTLEVTYTVPGGTRSIWIFKLVAAALVLLCAELLLALATLVFFAGFPLAVLYRAFQGAAFFLVLATGAGALLGNKLSAALVCGGVLALMLALGFDNRWSPLFNPLAERYAASNLVAVWSLQNHIGVALVMIGIVSLSFSRAERRELLLRE